MYNSQDLLRKEHKHLSKIYYGDILITVKIDYLETHYFVFVLNEVDSKSVLVQWLKEK